MDGGENEMKKIWIIANWKSNKTIEEALEWISVVGPRLEERENIKVVICPPLVDVEKVAHAIKVGNYPLMVGVQNISPFESGAFTGEVSANLVKDFASLAILGHSERKKNFNETDEMVAQKTEQVLNNGMIPFVCLQDENTPVPEGCRLVAYEPPNAISTSGPGAKADSPDDAARAAKALKERYGEDLEVVYGGSVNAENAKVYMEKEELSGVLPGAASLDPEEFIKIVEIAQSL